MKANKRRPNIIIMLFACSMVISCKKYIRTESTCASHCFLEVYERSELGVSYLTDSTNFKIYVGQLNFENEYYKYDCKNDTIIILKYSTDYFTKTDHIIETTKYDLNQLRKSRKFEN